MSKEALEINEENAMMILKKYLLNHKKYEHSLRVAEISKVLAEKWGASVSDAVIIALLHDIGKSMSKQQILRLCVRNNITIYDFELFENITALHGKVSSLIFENEFKNGTNNDERIKRISHAISSHVAGDEEMNLLDKIIFIADNLDSKEGSDELIAQNKSGDILPDDCVKRVIEQKKRRSESKNRLMNPLLEIANTINENESGR